MADVKLSPIDALDADIVEAWRELGEARDAFEHSPNAASALTSAYAQRRIDRLLDRRYEMVREAEVQS